MKVYLNKPDEEWIVDRFWDEWYEYNQNISTKILKMQILYGSYHHGHGKN